MTGPFVVVLLFLVSGHVAGQLPSDPEEVVDGVGDALEDVVGSNDPADAGDSAGVDGSGDGASDGDGASANGQDGASADGSDQGSGAPTGAEDDEAKETPAISVLVLVGVLLGGVALRRLQ